MASNDKAGRDEKMPPSVASSRPEEEAAPPQQPLVSYDGTVVRVVTKTFGGGSTKKEPDATTSGQSDGAPIEADPVKSEDAAATPPPSKKIKVEKGPFLEIRWYKDSEDVGRGWENGTYHGGELREHYYSIFADEIPKRTKKFNKSCVFARGEFGDDKEGENHEYRLTMCLVDGKAEDRNVLVEIGVCYWILPINLMHFHILSQDLANLSRKLWVAAGTGTRTCTTTCPSSSGTLQEREGRGEIAREQGHGDQGEERRAVRATRENARRGIGGRFEEVDRCDVQIVHVSHCDCV